MTPAAGPAPPDDACGWRAPRGRSPSRPPCSASSLALGRCANQGAAAHALRAERCADPPGRSAT